MTPLEHTIRWTARHATITMPAEIDTTNADDLTRVIRDVIGQRPEVVTVDLTTTTYCDSAGIRALILAHRHAVANGCPLRLIVGDSPVSRVLTLTGLDQVMPLTGGDED